MFLILVVQFFRDFHTINLFLWVKNSAKQVVRQQKFSKLLGLQTIIKNILYCIVILVNNSIYWNKFFRFKTALA
jgi:hypothetical protein